MFRMRADGSNPETVTFLFHGASKTTTSLNLGPDGETGFDYFTSGIVGSTEYLFAAPAKSSGNLNYLYYTTDSGTTINFDYINYGGIVDGGSKGTSSMTVFNGRLYVGFPGTGGQRPLVSKLSNVVQSPVTGTDIFNLQGQDMPRIGNGNSASIVGIDVMAAYNDRLYIANGGDNIINADGGILKSTLNDPRDYRDYPGDWLDITPTALNPWNNLPAKDRFSIEMNATYKLTPAQRAFPNMVVFNGKLYAIRNTTGTAGGPQIWKYNDTSWTTVGDSGGICAMGNANNSRITMLIRNGDMLYVGYDNPTDGVTVYRTKSGVTDPSLVGDFEQVGAGGLGDPAGNVQIFSALSASHDGVDYLWMMCGKSTTKQNLYRTKN